MIYSQRRLLRWDVFGTETAFRKNRAVLLRDQRVTPRRRGIPSENLQLIARYPRRQASMGEYPRCMRGGVKTLNTRGRFYIAPSHGFLLLTAGLPDTAVT